MSTITPLTDNINALTAYANNKTGASDTNLSDAVTRLVNGYGSGSSTIEDGIIVKARNSNGYATEVDFYNSDGQIPYYQFGNGRANAASSWPYAQVQKVNLKGSSEFIVSSSAFREAWSLTDIDWDKIISIKNNGVSNSGSEGQFRGCRALETVNAPNLTGGLSVYCFFDCKSLKTVYLPKVTDLYGYSNNRGCLQTNGGAGMLTSVEIGSIGYPVTYVHEYSFNTSMNGTITMYTNSSYIDTLLSKLRTNCSDATIIIKAAEALTYNDVSYAAGDTIITSTPSTT